MSTALFTGLSGLRSFETYLDVIGNNISNANTTGYRCSRVTFGDLLSLTTAPGSAPTATLGGKNPAQIGLGVGVKSIDQNTNAGSLLATDRNLDLTIFGPGFFMVNDGSRDLYTRAGTFGFDASGQLVEIGTGYLVQSSTNSSIIVPPNSIAPPQATSEISLKGNLPAKVTGPLPEILSSSSPFYTGTAATITGTSSAPFALSDGDSFSVQVDGGPPQTVTFHASDFVNIGAATAAEVAAVINAAISGVTASDAAGVVKLSSDTIGTASQIKLTDINNSPAFLMGLSTVLVQGTQTQAAGTTDLNDLVINTDDYVAGADGIEIQGSLSDGTQFAATFVYGAANDGTTLQELVDFIDNLMTDADVHLDSQSNIVVEAQDSGEAQYSLSLEDAPGNTGSTNFTTTAFTVTQEGTDPDQVNTAITIYDRNGEAHVLSLTFERVDTSEWLLTAALSDGSGTITDDRVGNITFDQEGTLQTAGSGGLDDTNIEIVFSSTGQQTIDLDLGAGIDGVTQFGGPATAQAISQDGYAAGTLADIVVTEDGQVNGVFTNGQTQSYGQIALAAFANPGGLKREGNNMFSDTVNSGVPQLGVGGGAGGTIQSGVLESSNVDLAEEFVRMIEAQRGYQASARIIRASEELLQNLLQNI
ncbi:MAG: flagellar hook-basal body complex protein [Planctomycetes bacterium]|nr:flagellar hook-basal body complex protein [Planctomycetota bacterium]